MRDLEQMAVGTLELGGPSGLYSRLDSIEVFSADPLRKKARILAHQLVRRGLVKVSDEKSLAPAIDYHLIRLYVRTGRVVPAAHDMYSALSGGRTMRIGAVTRLRQAVEEAMWHTAEGAGLRMDELNHIEWQIARSFCLRVDPRCLGEPLAEKPVDVPLAELSASKGGCPASHWCVAFGSSWRRQLQDPRLARSYY